MLNKLHWLGYTESYAETQNYKYCFINNKNGVGISDTSGALGAIVEETDDQIDDELEVDVNLETYQLQRLMKVKYIMKMMIR